MKVAESFRVNRVSSVVANTLRKFYTKGIKNINWLINVRFKYAVLKEADILIFEDTNTDYIIPLCDNFSYKILDTYLTNPSICIRTIINTLKFLFFGNSIKTSYCSAIIKQTNPKIVITFIDNSVLFYSVARVLHKEIYFLAIQNASRYDTLELSDKKARKIFIPNFACFGEYEKDMYISRGANVGAYYPIGSLRESYFRKYLKMQDDITLRKYDYDICLVSEASPGYDKRYPGLEDAIGRIAQYAIRYCKENNLKLVIAGKRDFFAPFYSGYQNNEIESAWYEKYTGNSVKITPRVRDEFTTYNLVNRSRLALSIMSTSLREGAGRGNKVLFCNFSNHKVFNFPVEGIMSLTEGDYNSFSSRVTDILNYSKDEYNSKTNNTNKYVMNNSDKLPTDVVLKNMISNLINNKC